MEVSKYELRLRLLRNPRGGSKSIIDFRIITRFILLMRDTYEKESPSFL